MPDSSLGLRPVVRRSSAIHSDLLSRFEGRRPSTSSITSSGTPSGVTSPSSSISSTATPYTLERTKSILEKSEKSIKTRTGSVKTKVSRTKAEVSFLSKSLNQTILNKTITKNRNYKLHKTKLTKKSAALSRFGLVLHLCHLSKLV